MDFEEFSTHYPDMDEEEKQSFFKFIQAAGNPLLRSLIRDGIIDIERTPVEEVKSKFLSNMEEIF